MQGSGLAHVCLITGALTITKARIELNIPKKRTGSTQHGKSMMRFYEAVYQAILRHIDFAKVKCVLLGSPGFVNEGEQALVLLCRAAHSPLTLLSISLSLALISMISLIHSSKTFLLMPSRRPSDATTGP
jgi:hypothetical protein